MGRQVRLMEGRFWSAVGGFYPGTCAIQQATETADSYGELMETWAAVGGMEAIPCRVSPAGGTERKSPQAIWSVATHVINLQGGFRTITAKMRAVVDCGEEQSAMAYDILLAQVDGGGEVTRLVCEVVR